MDIVKDPEAQALLADAELSAATVQSCADRLEAFVTRFLPCFRRVEQEQHARTILRGKLTGLQRKTTEPIANDAGENRRPLQLFVGAGAWDDEDVLQALRQDVAAELGDADAVFILDPSSFPKKGTASCGVARQWCGRLGKIDNCQTGAFVAYAAPRGCTLLQARLYLPEDWAADAARRERTHVPADVTFQEKWRLSLDLLDQARATLPGRWVVGDDELGRCSALRAALRQRRLSYVLDVPCNTLVREVAERHAPRGSDGRTQRPAFERVDQWVARQPKGRWREVTVRDGEKGPQRVKVLLATVQTKDEDGTLGARERLAVLRSCEATPQTWYTLNNAHEARRREIAQVHGTRHRVEELFGQGNAEVGLDHYEVRSWVGWHHHMTLSLLALWFLHLERLRIGKKNPGGHGRASAGHLHGAAASASSQRGADCRSGEQGLAA